MQSSYRVFISSSSSMGDDRAEVIRAVRACGCVPAAMEDWPVSSRELAGEIEVQIRQCDFMVLLVGWDRGFDWPGGHGYSAKSYVEHEYEFAKHIPMPVIPLLKEPLEPPDGSLEAQKSFRQKLRDTLVTKTYRDLSDLGAYVRSSLLALIRPKEEASVLETNAELTGEVASYLNECNLRNKPVKRARLVRYSGQNARDILRKLLWANVKTKLYLGDTGGEHIFSEHQSEWIRSNVRQLPNYIDPLDASGKRKDVLKLLKVYPYDAPAAIRVVEVGDDFLAIGCYTYMKKHPGKKRKLDVRGGELPMFLFRGGHSGFPAAKRMVDSMLKNWKRYGVVPNKPLAI